MLSLGVRKETAFIQWQHVRTDHEKVITMGMDLRNIDELKGIINQIDELIRLLDKEYSVILDLILYIGKISNPMAEELKFMYLEKLNQITQLRDRNRQFIEYLRRLESLAYWCSASAKGSFTDSDLPVELSVSDSDLADELSVSDSDQNEMRSEFVSDSDQTAMIPKSDSALSFDSFLSGKKSKSLRYKTQNSNIVLGNQIPHRKFADEHDRCRKCGTKFNHFSKYCPVCGTKAEVEKPVVLLDKVQFSAVAPKTFVKGEYSIIDIYMYEEAFRYIVDEAIANGETAMKETRSGILMAEKNAKISIVLSSPDMEIEDNNEIQIWQGDYLCFSFAVELPEHYKKTQILFMSSVYINDLIATKLKFVVKCKSSFEQKIEVFREDILSAFVSYASQDRNRVALIIQGMKKARPDMDIFFDVDSLRSGDNWENALWREIDKRDVLFLCWSKYARDSKWVDAEWRYALKQKGEDRIEPVPIDPPSSCPPPDELSHKHFNERLLYFINS